MIDDDAFADLVHSPRFTGESGDVAPPPATVDRVPATSKRRKAPGEKWEDRHVRRTFHLPRQVSDAFDEAVRADEDLSLASAATEAIEAWLRRRKAAARKVES